MTSQQTPYLSRPSGKAGLNASLSEEERWHLIAQNLKAWYLSWPTSNSTTLFLSNPDTLLTPERATIGSPKPSDDRIDTILNYYRTQKPAKEVLIWYLNSSPPDLLNAKILARGVGIGWSVEWMWCDLTSAVRPNIEQSSVDDEIKITTSPVKHSDISSTPHQYILTAQLSNPLPQHVATVTLNLTPGNGVVAGMFSMSVLPTFRNRGIGTKLAKAACDLARELECRYIYLNATKMGKKIYERVGFEKISDGIIWRLDRRLCQGFYSDAPPRKELVMFLEAVCLGDLNVLKETSGSVRVEEMGKVTGNGMTALEMAVSCGQIGSAEWLLSRGVVGDVLSFWDLGWKERARDLVQERPGLVHVKNGRTGAMPLQVALDREDQELAELLASVPPPPRPDNKIVEIDLGSVDWEKRFETSMDSDVDLVESVEELSACGIASQ